MAAGERQWTGRPAPVGQALHRTWRHRRRPDRARAWSSPPVRRWPLRSGHLMLAIVLLILTGFHDLLDGPVAKAAGTASVRGAFFDSVTDRVADAC